MHPKSLADVSAFGLSMLAAALALGTGAATLPAADLSGNYTWNSVMVGGGGCGALVFESPAAPGVIYFKDDCSSIYRLDEGATVWKTLNTRESLPAGYAVQGARGANMACAADDANRAYMSYDRNLFYSDDQGDSWKKGTISPPLTFMNEVDNPQPQRGCDSFSLVGSQAQPIYNNSAACDAAGTFYVAAGSNTNNDGKIYRCARGGAMMVDYFCQGAGPSTKAPLWKSTDGGATWASVSPNLTQVLMAGWGKTISGASYPTNNYIFDNVKDIDGDKTAEGKVYVILGGTSLVYGTCQP